jgi:hypothetical protein
MAQNTSSAVMQQRAEPHDSLDDFPTPPWATRALCKHVLRGYVPFGEQGAWEPACNRGHMALPLKEYFRSVYSSDIFDYGWKGQQETCDFLFPSITVECDWIITNPPFRLAEQFILKARTIARRGVAVLVRSAFLEGIGRYNSLFKESAPAIIAQFVERVVMVKGRLDPVGSTATSYCWLVWFQPPHVSRVSQTHWIPPCRKQLEREDDYL